jgi:hypothetical protein
VFERDMRCQHGLDRLCGRSHVGRLLGFGERLDVPLQQRGG